MTLALGAMVFGAASTARAAGAAVFSATKPAVGSVSLTKPSWIAVTADDSLPIFSATVTINGLPAPVCIDRPIGHFVYDEEQESEVWVVDDLTVARLMSYSPGNRVVPGVNTVVATVTGAGGVSTYTWTFNYGTATTVSSVSPAQDAVLPASPAVLSAGLTSPSTSFTSAMTVDGAVVALTYSSATKTFTHTPATALAAGMHTAVFSVRDANGSVTRTWSFKVSPPMSSGAECTSCHAAYPAAHPVSGCESCHDHGYTVAGGTHGNRTPTAAGCAGSGAEQAGACHRLDHSSDAQYGIWGSGPFQCADCHSASHASVPRHTDASTTAVHAGTSNACGPCHTSSLITEHAKYPSAAAIKYQCDLCHGLDASPKVKDAIASGVTGCGSCHGGATGHEAQHATTLNASCVGCHDASLLTEHSKRGMSCDSCHSSSALDVRQSIALSLHGCSDCHNAAHGESLTSSVPADIPLSSEFAWSNPISADVYAGETWMPASYIGVGARIVLSGRAQVTPAVVWDYYRQQMEARGWVMSGSAPVPGSSSFTVSFSKGSKRAVLWCYGGMDHAPDPVLASGYRVEIAYDGGAR